MNLNSQDVASLLNFARENFKKLEFDFEWNRWTVKSVVVAQKHILIVIHLQLSMCRVLPGFKKSTTLHPPYIDKFDSQSAWNWFWAFVSPIDRPFIRYNHRIDPYTENWYWASLSTRPPLKTMLECWTARTFYFWLLNAAQKKKQILNPSCRIPDRKQVQKVWSRFSLTVS